MPRQAKPKFETGYAPVNGLELYYEIHGKGSPLILLHGALSATGTSFGKLLPELARQRQVISVEMQAHGHTADIDRPLTLEAMAKDTAAALRYLGVANADFFGYSMGSGVALHVALTHPELVRKLILASITFNNAGFVPGLVDMMSQMNAEMMVGTPWQVEYAQIAPHPENWASLVEKNKHMDTHLNDIPAAAIQAITAPTLIIIGDSDIVRPEHAVELYRLLGGGVPVDASGLSRSQLAVLPGTSHITVIERADLLLPMIPAFLDAPIPVPAAASLVNEQTF